MLAWWRWFWGPEFWCWLCDHDWSWVEAVMIGVTDGPICRRCGKQLGRPL